ncbi:hypothetical protein [Saprospira grandis]|uniref:hypothetical protein n=1 Tax=Saprospira grandis TaxID=1008 RepID=UPI0022DDF4C1|nr:hypothetical protein [Saprospira grandis]WBM76132.1 hypothetical protein OP864_07840 [Saprospira grandis]
MILEDLYIAISSFSNKAELYFCVEEFVKNHTAESDYYDYPLLEETLEFETEDFMEMLHFIVSNKKAYHFYFSNLENKENPKRMIFINSDQSIYFGLAVYEIFSLKYQEILKAQFPNSPLMICNHVLPPNSFEAFKQQLKTVR